MNLRVAVLVALALSFPAQALAGLAAPVAMSPDDGTISASVPAVGWSPVVGADHYLASFSSAEDFSAPVLQGEISTSNTWATLVKALPHGTYWWRVRAVTRLGGLGPWSSPATSFGISLPAPTAAITALAPADGGSLTFPAAPTVRWSPIAGAASYRLKAGSDPGLTALDGVANYSQATDAAELTFTGALTPGATYYWQVVPIDAEKSEGTASPVFSFTWRWTSTTTTRYVNLRDPSALDPDPAVVDPQFSWDPIPGAVRYQVQVSSSRSLTDSIFLDRTTVGTRLSPIANLPNNSFYWQVRGIDAAGNNGVWNAYGGDPLNPLAFLKSFYTSTLHPITHLRLVDSTGTTITAAMPTVSSPLVTWDPMPGASAYMVEVRLAQMTYDPASGVLTSAVCTNAVLGEYWDDIVATNAWTPLGIKPANTSGPWPNHATLSFDGIIQMVAGHRYCVRVRPYSADSVDGSGAKSPVYGAWTELDGGYGAPAATVSFGFAGYSSCSVSCVVDYPAASSYLLPVPGGTITRTPYFTWAADPNASGYFVIVAQDKALTSVIDYAYVHGTAYAPRTPRAPVSYPDEGYYWAVLPSATVNGAGAPINATRASPQPFSRASVTPTLIGPLTSPPAGQRPTFLWSAVEGARTYRLVVASDDKFSSIVETLLTPATSYTPEVTYPAGDLYWRVAAVDWDDVQLSWTTFGRFKNVLPAPTLPTQVTHADMIPTFLWNVVPGAVGYRVETNSPPGIVASVKKVTGPYGGAGVTFLKLDGTGIWRWRVQAVFPGKTGTVPGDWSPLVDFDNTMAAPAGSSSANQGHGLLLSWQPMIGAAHYRVEVSRRPDMAVSYVERVLVDSPAYAPAMIASGYKDGGKLYWHVAAVDETRNTGKFSEVRSFALPARLVARAAGMLRKGKRGSIIVTVTDVQRVSLAGATVRISGAGISRTLRTSSSGSATWKGTARRGGTVTVTVSKPGYQTMAVVLTVR